MNFKNKLQKNMKQNCYSLHFNNIMYHNSGYFESMHTRLSFSKFKIMSNIKVKQQLVI